MGGWYGFYYSTTSRLSILSISSWLDIIGKSDFHAYK